MPDHLDALIARSVDGSATIEPRVPALFEPKKLEREPVPEARDQERPKAIARQPEVRTADRQSHVGRAIDMLRETAHDRDPQAAGSESKNDVSVRDRPDGLAARLVTLEEQLRTRNTRPTADLEAVARLVPAIEKARDIDRTAPPLDVMPGKTHDADPDRSGLPPRPRSPIRSAPEDPRFGSRLDAFSHRLDSLAQRLDEESRPIAELRRGPHSGDDNPKPESASPDRIRHHAEARALSPRVESPTPRRTLQSLSAPQRQTYVEVTIGRIELRAVTEREQPKPARVNSVAPTTLDDYLRHRNGGRR